ncbi:MAG TPA: hypothetical protein DHW49_07760, partial [Anaerolineae bacterium]|nr:hypothetical protein [Anaerolineae bacterium]
MIKKVLGIHYKSFLFFFVLGASITFALGHSMQFHSTGNDFWNILYYGRNMTLSEPESLYNGFYPFGYAFIIGQMPFTYILPIAYIINSLLAGLFTASTATLSLYARNVFAVLIATFGSIAAPFVFQSTHTIGPDIGAAAFVAFAVFLLWKNHFEEQFPFPKLGEGLGVRELTDLHSILIGASLGLGFLTRTHVIVSVIAIFIGYFLLFGIRPFRSRLIMIGAFFCFVLMQIIVNLVSGHGALETAQAFNMYKFLYGFNPTYPPTPNEIEKFSFIKVIFENPKLFFYSYWGQFRFISSFSWTSIICFLLSPRGQFAKLALFSFITSILYSIPIVVGDSPRAPLMVMSAYVVCMGLIPVVFTQQIERYYPKSQWLNIAVAIFFFMIYFNTFRGWILYDTNFVYVNQTEQKNLRVIENTLLSNGMNSPSEVYSDRYDFYTPNTMPYRSRQIGNWNIDWVWGYSVEFPILPSDNLESFLNACKEQGVRFLALSPNSHFRGEIFSQIYNEEVDIELLGLKFIGQRGNIRLYEI